MKGAPVPILVNPAAGRGGEASAGRMIHADHAGGTTLDGEIDRIRTPLYVGVRDAALRILAAA